MTIRLSKSEVKKLGIKSLNDSNEKLSKGRMLSQNNERVIQIEFEEKAVPKHRPRTFIDEKSLSKAFHNAKNFRQFMGMIKTKTITTKETKDFEKRIALEAKLKMKQNKPIKTPLKLEIIFIFDGKEEEYPVAHKDGDLDNLEKSLCDALNGIVYEDDRLIVEKKSKKICKPNTTKIILKAESI
jgi:Holliday junction resolvase RusA-like endonuclease